jgi:hypothetical protein
MRVTAHLFALVVAEQGMLRPRGWEDTEAVQADGLSPPHVSIYVTDMPLVFSDVERDGLRI